MYIYTSLCTIDTSRVCAYKFRKCIDPESLWQILLTMKTKFVVINLNSIIVNINEISLEGDGMPYLLKPASAMVCWKQQELFEKHKCPLVQNSKGLHIYNEALKWWLNKLVAKDCVICSVWMQNKRPF